MESYRTTKDTCELLQKIFLFQIDTRKIFFFLLFLQNGNVIMHLKSKNTCTVYWDAAGQKPQNGIAKSMEEERMKTVW